MPLLHVCVFLLINIACKHGCAFCDVSTYLCPARPAFQFVVDSQARFHGYDPKTAIIEVAPCMSDACGRLSIDSYERVSCFSNYACAFAGSGR